MSKPLYIAFIFVNMDGLLEKLDEYLASELSDSDMVHLESVLLKRLDDAGSQQAYGRLGFSKRLMRFHLEHNGGTTPTIEWQILRSFHGNYSIYTNKLERMLSRQHDTMQRQCEHEWEYDASSRDHRSRYTCTQCGAYR